MNTGKIKWLLARHIYGWSLSCGMDMYSDNQWYIWGEDSQPITIKQDCDWNPTIDLNDAMMVLETACKPNGWDLMRMSHEWPEQKDAYTARGAKCKNDDNIGRADTPALAMCLCALRVSGVPEEVILDAMQ